MKCKKCGNELKEGEKFCGKCGTKVDEKIIIENNTTNNESLKATVKVKSNYLVVIIIVVILIFGVIAGGVYYNNTVISDEYLTNNYRENGFSQFDNVEVKVLDIEDIEYKNFNKLVLAKVTINNNNQEVSNVGLLLVNKKENDVEGFTINNNLIQILNGVANNNMPKVKDITKLSAKYIQMVGTDIFQKGETEDFKNLINEYSKIIGLKESREYVKTGFAKQLNANLDYTLLFEKQSPIVKYIAFYEMKQVYNWSIPEQAAKILYSNDRKTYNNFVAIYGSPYKTVQQYTICDLTGKEIEHYSSLEKAKEKLNVD